MEYESDFVNSNIKQVGELNTINWDTLDIYGRYLEDKWIACDAGSADDSFELGIEIGRELQKLKNITNLENEQ